MNNIINSSSKGSSSNRLAKECIVSALIKLSAKKPLSSITISELCSKAGVSRMTFYRNYKSLEDIFGRHLTEVFEQYRNDADSCSELSDGIYYDNAHMTHYFNYLYDNRDFLDGLMRCGMGISFLNMLNEYILHKWQNYADKYTLISFSGSLYNMFYTWQLNYYEDTARHLVKSLESIYKKQPSP